MKFFTALLLLLGAAAMGYAQPYTLKGSVTDTLNNNQLYQASVVLMRAADTVIEAYGRTAQDGTFALIVPKPGKYILRISFPSFADYQDAVVLKKTVTDLGQIPMISKEHLLKEFVLTQQVAAIKIKGDTTEYVADSFKVKEGATVEDLLKRLPGIQVNKDGQITAQGETVQKILVDGEEFFSDDPKVVTQGLQANAIDKVQVFDKKSDQAEFTGIDDWKKTKTINLELKEDKKKGYFGKIDAGGGTDGYFQDQAMVNAFRSKLQFSAFGIMSNTDKVGLGWQDNDKFGSGNGVTTISDDGGVTTTYSGNSDADFGGYNGKYNGQGFPQTWTGGVHFADRWNADKDHLTGNYRYAMQNIELDGKTTTQYVLPGDAGFVTSQDKHQSSKGERHGLDLMYEWKLDSSTTLKLTTDGGYKQSETLSDYLTNTQGDDGAQLNRNSRNIKSNAYNDYVNADLLLKKKFKKKGRTLSVDVKENYKESKSNGVLNTRTDLYTFDTGLHPILDSVVTQDQQKISKTYTQAFAAKATYTEPLSKTAYVELDYGVTVNNSTNSTYSYDAGPGGGFNTFYNDTFSSNYRYNILSNAGGVNFKFNYSKISFSFGSDVSNASYVQTDLLHDSSKTYNYVNLFPRALFTYKMSKQSSIRLSYQGNTQQPSISQIAPLRQNNDPLNIVVGNDKLKQQFNHNFSLNFNDYKVLTGRYLFGTLSFTSVADAISTSQTTISGVNTTQYINVNGNYSGHAYVGGGKRIQKLDMMVGAQTNINTSHVNNIVNGTPNGNDNNSFGIGPYVNYDKTDKYEWSIQPNVSYNENKSTISTFSSSYWAFTTDVSFSVQLPGKFEIGSSANIMIREKTKVFTTNNNVVKWNAYVEKKFLKNGQLGLRAGVLDILNQNLAYSRYAQAGQITESTYGTIRRYGMLQLIWNFTHTPSGTPPPSGGMIMMR